MKSILLIGVGRFGRHAALTLEKLKLIKIDGTLKLYSTKTFRTNYRTNKFGIKDILLLGVYLIFFYYYLLESGLL